MAGFVCQRGSVRYLDKRVCKARHLHRRINGWGMGEAPLAEAEALGAQYARFHDPDTGEVWFADLALFRTKGVRIDQGHGPQWILPLRWWTTPDGQTTATAPHRGATQPALLDLAAVEAPRREVYP